MKHVKRNFGMPRRVFPLLLSLAALVLVTGTVFAGGAREQDTPMLEIPPQPRQYISPANQDGVQDELILPFSSVVVPGEDTVVVEYALTVFDSDGFTVYRQREVQTERRGFFGNLFGGEKPRVEIPDTLVWDGRYDAPENVLPPNAVSGEFVPDGEYTYQLSIVDDERNTSSSAPFNVTVDNTPPEVEDFPPLEYTIFAPTGDGLRDEIPFELRTSRELRWEVRIIDDRDETVYEEIFENPTPGRIGRDVTPPARFVWDGTVGTPEDEDRSPAPEGTYRLELFGADRAGNTTTVVHPQEVRLSLETADIALAPADGNPRFSPNDNGRRDTLPIRIDTTQPELVDRWTVEVLYRDLVVRSESGTGIPPTEWVLDGRRQDGSVLPDGPVRVRVRAVLINALEMQSAPLEVYIDTAAPEVGISLDTLPDGTPSGEPIIFGAGTKTGIEGAIRYDRDAEWTFRLTLEGQEIASGALSEFLRLSGVQPRRLDVRSLNEIELAWSGEALVESGDAPDGLYTLVLAGEDLAGNVARSREVRVIKDSRTPEVTLTTEDRFIAPLTDGPYAEIRYKIGYGVPERIREFHFEIRNEQGRVVRSEYRQRPFEEFLWQGLSNARTIVADGEYTADVTVFWQNGHSARVTGVGPVMVDRSAPILSVGLSPQPFAPDPERPDNTLKIDLDVEARSVIERWVVDILDPAGQRFRRFSGEGDPPDTIEWDGRSDEGELVQFGTHYPLRFTVEDSIGNVVTEEARIAVAHVGPPRLEITLDPIPFRPDDEGVDDILTIGLSVQAETRIDRWEVEILDPRNRPFRFFRGTGDPPESILWDGLSDEGELVQSAMDYPVRFTVYDEFGNVVSEEAIISTDILVMRENGRLRIRVASIHFVGFSADLFMSEPEQLNENLVTLRRLAQILNRYPDRSIVVEGHAAHLLWRDPQRKAREQQEALLPLSRRRAEEVIKALIILGVDRERMTVSAIGGDRPVVPHSDIDNLWKNRRVEFLLDE